MSVQISVIIPVYNTVRYLEECVQSVLQQTYRDFEVVLADDGSTDGSAELCQALCARDSRVRLLRLEHGGVSAARNAAMEAARGEYLFFLDSDDGIHPRMLETLYALAEETGAELAGAGTIRIEEQDPFPIEEEGEELSYSSLSSQETLAAFFSETPEGFILLVCRGLMLKRSALEGLRFDESMIYSEDTKFVYQLLTRGGRAVLLQKRWYYYRYRSSSATGVMSWQSRLNIFRNHRETVRSEWEHGRRSNAAIEEERVVARLLEAYRYGRKMRDSRMLAQLREMVRQERKEPTFPLMSLRVKMKFYLGFYCYPLYLPIHHVLHRMWRWRSGQTERER